jgi:hypothetical protein
MKDKEFDFAYNYIENCRWLEERVVECTDRYWAVEKKITDKNSLSDKDIEHLDQLHAQMEELENRLMFEEREYVRVRKKLDEMEL